MKKGFSLVTLLVTIFVIIILISTVVISANSIYNSNKKVKFASEISYIKELVNSYMVNNNGNLPSNSEVITSIRDISKDEMQSQFQGLIQVLYNMEMVLRKKVMIYIVYLKKQEEYIMQEVVK